VVLRLEHVHHVRPERLVGHDDVRAGRITLPVHGELGGRLMHGDTRLEERVDELRRRREVWLARGEDVPARIAERGRPKRRIRAVLRGAHRRGHRASTATATASTSASAARCPHDRLGLRDAAGRRRPRVAIATLDRVLPHPVDVEQEVLTHLRGDVEHRTIGGHRIVDRLAEVPGSRPDRKWEIGARKLLARDERDLDRRRVANRLRKEADHVVEVRRGAEAAVPPRGVAGSRAARDPALPFDREAVVHRRTNEVDADRDERIEVVVEWVAEGRREHHGARGTRLVVIVHDLGIPLAVHLPVHVLGLRLRRAEEITVVVVTDVLLIELRNPRTHPALLRVRVFHVPVGGKIVPVRIGMDEEHDCVVEEPKRLVVVAAHDLVERLHQLLRAEHLGGVQASVDPHDRLPFLREGAGLLIRESLGQGELPRDLLVAREIPVIGGRGDDRHELGTALGRLPHLLHHHPIALGVELSPVVGELLVVGEVIVIADVEAELLLRAGDLAGGRHGHGLGRGLLRGERRAEEAQRGEQGEGDPGHRLLHFEHPSGRPGGGDERRTTGTRRARAGETWNSTRHVTPKPREVSVGNSGYTQRSDRPL
jgi:hypothetical protein